MKQISVLCVLNNLTFHISLHKKLHECHAGERGLCHEGLAVLYDLRGEQGELLGPELLPEGGVLVYADVEAEDL